MKKLKIIVLILVCILMVGCGKTHTVTFKDGDNEYRVEVSNKKTVDKIDPPTKDGYKFIGWYVDDKPFDFNTEITNDIVITPKWEKTEDTTIEVKEDNNSSVEDTKKIQNQEEETKPITTNNSNNTNTNNNNDNTSSNNNNNTNNNQQSNNNPEVKPQNIVKTIEESENIPFSTSTQNEVNMLRGVSEIIQNGENGVKTITYKVTYDAKGKEISREKISEKIIKQPTNQITKVGVSDYNLNTDSYSFTIGYMCTKDKYIDTGDGNMDCIIEEGKELNGCILGLKNGFYFTHVANGTVSCTDQNRISNMVKAKQIDSGRGILNFNYNGQEYYFITGGGTGGTNLTMEICNTYNLACGRW